MQLLKGDASLVGFPILKVFENYWLGSLEQFLVAEDWEDSLELDVSVVQSVAIVVGVVGVHVLLGQLRAGLAPNTFASSTA